ncbi:MAG: hypothetical protein JWM77_4297 [Rhodospirillales bacterium]|nr:hypothetical protein [Rhodospirillales bacterium]
MFGFSVSFSDPTGTLGSNTAALIQSDLEGALRWLGRYIQGLGSLDVAATTASQGSNAFLAQAGPDAFGVVGHLASGGLLQQPGPAYEFTTGRDPNGSSRSDFHITINVDRMALFWFDPTPDDLTDRPPSSLIDFEAVMVHETMHALGFIGNRQVDGSFFDGDRTPYDQAMRLDPALGWVYDSEAVRAANNGNPVAIDSTHDTGSRWYHLAVPNDMMFWAASAGVRRQISDVDLAVLHDNGIQSVTPDANDNVWFGSDGADGVLGLPGDDHLYGLAGNDRLDGWQGNDLIDGGAGFDTSAYANVRAAYIISGTTGNRIVQAQAGGSEGTDTLRHVELLQFADKAMFDVAGADATVARLYSAAFARAPDAAGLANQLDTLHAGVTPLQLAQNFLGSAEFIARYGTSQDDNQYITALYANVLGRAPDGVGFAVQMNALTHGQDRAQLLLNFGESAENQSKVASDWLLV